MTDCVKAALVINEECLDIKGVFIQDGKVIALLDDHTQSIFAGDLQQRELLDLLALLKMVLKSKTIIAR